MWNRTPGKTKQLAAAGAKVAATPAALAARRVVITILTDATAIDAAYNGPPGLLAGDVKGKLFIEMSTVRPEIESALAEKVRAKGRRWSIARSAARPARRGTASSSASSAASDADVARAKPVLEQLCRRVEHVGPVGAGARMKLAINLPLLVYWQALGEALALARPLKLEPERLIDIFADTSGAPNVLKTRGPSIATQLAGGNVPPTFDVDSIRKDLRTMIEEGRSLGVELPVTARALECFDRAAGDGLGGADCTKLPAYWAEHGGRAGN